MRQRAEIQEVLREVERKELAVSDLITRKQGLKIADLVLTIGESFDELAAILKAIGRDEWLYAVEMDLRRSAEWQYLLGIGTGAIAKDLPAEDTSDGK